MTNIPSDDEIREAYAALDKDHGRLRSELLAAMTRLTAAAGRAGGQRAFRARWSTIALSACVLIVAAIWLALIGMSPRPAYAIDGLHERLLKVRSLHVKGWIFPPNHGKPGDEPQTFKLPLEWYAERPTRYWNIGHSISGNGPAAVVRTNRLAVDGSRTLLMSEDEQSCVLGETSPLATELRVEWLLQSQWTRQLLGGPSADYRLIGKDRIEGRDLLQYELKESQGPRPMRHVIWLNPVTGLPARCAIYSIDAQGREQPSLLCEHIEFNGPPAPHMFSFEPPAGYNMVKKDKEALSDPFSNGSASASNKDRRDRTASRYSFAIDNLAVVVCWQHSVEKSNDDGPPLDPIALTLESSREPKREWDLHPVATRTLGKETWHWSLAIPRDHRPLDAAERLSLKFAVPKGAVMMFDAFPLRFDDGKLSKILSRMQEGPAPANGEPSDESFTLTRLRWKAAQILTRPADAADASDRGGSQPEAP